MYFCRFKKILPVIYLLSIFFFLCAPLVASAAGTKKIGEQCFNDNDSECISGDCEESNIIENGKNKWFCDCKELQWGAAFLDSSSACSEWIDGSAASANSWICKDGDNYSHDIDYCLNKSSQRRKNPLDKLGDGSYMDAILNPEEFLKNTGSELDKIIKTPQPRINIPGLTFSTPQPVTGDDGRTYLYMPFIGEYVSAVYKYAIIVFGVLAVIMIIIAGFQWIVMPEDHSEAIKKIQHAVTGLVIAVGSYTILWVINPELVNFKSLRVQYVIGEEWDNKANESVQQENQNPNQVAASFKEIVPPSGISPGSVSFKYNDVPYFTQLDAKWKDTVYGSGSDCSTYGQAACGPTSIAMILKKFGKDVDPTTIGSIAVATNARGCHGGTSMISAFISELQATYKIKITQTHDKEVALQALRQNKLLLQGGSHIGFSSNNSIRTYEGHYIVYTGIETINGTEIIHVNDSATGNPDRSIVYTTKDLFYKGVAYVNKKATGISTKDNNLFFIVEPN